MKGSRSHRGKSAIRALVRRGAQSSKNPRVTRSGHRPPREPTICASCGAVFVRRTWRQRRPLDRALLDGAEWGTCLACRQVRRGEYYGRVLVRESPADRQALLRRIRNVARRAEFTQPERKIVSMQWDGAGLEVLTTSQKLAHRIARELTKAFRGRATFRWSARDGSLLAVWQPTPA